MAIKYCTKKRLVQALSASNSWLECKKDIVNNLNVFPVPDGDTGLNMSLTLQAANEAIQSSESDNLAQIASEIVQSTLMGARGCSGVILSQFFNGFAEGIGSRKRLNALELAQALRQGADAARGGVREPVEGTILTVMRHASEFAVGLAESEDDLTEVLQGALRAATESLRQTPELLPVLKDAGVVDAGGQGFVYMLEGILRLIEGQPLEEVSRVEVTVARMVNAWKGLLSTIRAKRAEEIGEAEVIAAKLVESWKGKLGAIKVPSLRSIPGLDRVGSIVAKTWESVLGLIRQRNLKDIKGVDKTAERAVSAWERELEYKYCTEFLIKGEDLALKQIEAELGRHGDCVMVVGTPWLAKVHLHTNDPESIIEYAYGLGEVSRVKIDDMDEQHQSLLAEEVAPAKPRRYEPRRYEDHQRGENYQRGKHIGVVAFAPGEWMAEILKSMGVDKLIGGPRKLKPSTQDITRAIESVDARSILALPNDGDIIPVAEQAAKLSNKEVCVIPSRTIPEGISALLNFSPEVSLEENKGAMTQALGKVKTGQVAKAAREALYKDLKIKKGDIIGLYNRKIEVKNKRSFNVAASDLITKMVDEESQLITIFYGKEVSKTQAERLGQQTKKDYPDLVVELYRGGQPQYYYIISVE